MKTLSFEFVVYSVGQSFRRVLDSYKNGWNANPNISSTQTQLALYPNTGYQETFVCSSAIYIHTDSPIEVVVVQGSTTSNILITDIFVLSYTSGFTVTVKNLSTTAVANITSIYS